MPSTGTIPLQNAIPNQLITSALWNAELANINSLLTPAGVDTYSDTDAKMQIQTNPFPGSVTSHATALAGELERLRYMITLITGKPFWYQPPDENLGSGGITPIGTIIDFPVATPPNANWHLCNGAAVGRVPYFTLWTMIGATFGNGDGVNTFNLPDYQDRMSIGAGNVYAVGAKGGEATHILTSAEMPTHNHGVTDPGHAHGVTDPGHTHVKQFGTPGGGDNNFSMNPQGSGAPTSTANSATGLTVNSATTGISTGNTGSGGAHNNLPPYLAMYKMIRLL